MLEAELLNGLRRRSNENQAGLFYSRRKLGVLRKKPIARDDSLCTIGNGDFNYMWAGGYQPRFVYITKFGMRKAPTAE